MTKKLSKPMQGGASIDENGRPTAGRLGIRLGRELRRAAWYIHKKGLADHPRKAQGCEPPEIAAAMERAVNNLEIGYDQWQRDTLWKLVKDRGFDPGKADKPVETDCSALVAVCVQHAFTKCGIPIMLNYDGFRTTNMTARLMATGEFELLTSDMYCKNSNGDYLVKGDIACTLTQGHTVVLLGDGQNAGKDSAEPTRMTIRKGDQGDAVRAAQSLLMGWNADALPKWGADSAFGSETDEWARRFQKAHALAVDGIIGSRTWAALYEYGAPIKPDVPQKPRALLSKGDSGEDVRHLQARLLAWDAKCLPRYGADGDFGGETLAAVRTLPEGEGSYGRRAGWRKDLGGSRINKGG